MRWEVDEDANLGQVFIDYTDDPRNKDKTFDDFFDDIGIEEGMRNDFLVAAILKQAQEIERTKNEKNNRSGTTAVFPQP